MKTRTAIYLVIVAAVVGLALGGSLSDRIQEKHRGVMTALRIYDDTAIRVAKGTKVEIFREDNGQSVALMTTQFDEPNPTLFLQYGLPEKKMYLGLATAHQSQLVVTDDLQEGYGGSSWTQYGAEREGSKVILARFTAGQNSPNTRRLYVIATPP